ncbi:Hpt domain-containing protein [Chitinivorax sp. B]|uniref:Hpt domain-containing protein n=1 Tax=Chitinivorax sp. B TaxID=2502235 RepID=UPI0010F4DF6A|nr:Hpt domain-containing protein [Chitinivorax sp. B]
MNAFVAKPFNVDDLLETILKLTRYTMRNPDPTPLAPAPLSPPLPTPKAPQLPDLPGIDFERGMRSWGEIEIYRKFLGKFAEDYADCGAQLNLLYQNKDWAALRGMAHKLVGAAGNLALVEVYPYASEIEGAIVRNEDPADAVCRLNVALETALESIAEWVGQAELRDSTVTAPLQHEVDSSPLLAELIRALDTDNPDQAEPVLNALAGAIQAESLMAIRACIDAFDFRSAEQLARQLATDLQIVLEE